MCLDGHDLLDLVPHLPDPVDGRLVGPEDQAVGVRLPNVKAEWNAQ